jgi:hypothetical protein
VDPRKKAEQLVTGLEDPLNVHVLKLLALDVPEDTRRVWKRELMTWARRIAAIRLKPDERCLPKDDLYRWLYEEPYGATAAENVAAVLAIEGSDFQRNPLGLDEIVQRHNAVVEGLAEHFSRGNPAQEVIAAL